MKTLILLRGLPGAGKSTVANLLSESGKYPVLSADMYFEDSEGNYNWDSSKIKDAHQWCRIEVEKIMSGSDMYFRPGYPLKIYVECGDKIFVANTFTQEWEMRPYYELAEKYGYMVVSLICENRHKGQNVHDVPEETIEKMQQRFEVKL